jgi:hypothetical protein
MVNRTVGIASDLGHFTVFGIDQDAATTVAHPAVAFDHRIISVNFHLLFHIGVNKSGHMVYSSAYR